MLQTSGRYTVDRDTLTIRAAAESDAGQYWCRGQRDRRPNSSHLSSAVSLSVAERPKPVVKVSPDQRVFRGETVTLTCDIQGGGNIQWTYSWFKDGNTRNPYIKRAAAMFSFRADYVSDRIEYSCRGERSYLRSSEMSAAVTLTVSERPKPVVHVHPEKNVFSGEKVTLTCHIQQTGDWQYSWNKDENHVSSAGQDRNYIISPVDRSHSGVYSCGGTQSKAPEYSQMSDGVTLTVSERPKPVVKVSPDQRVFRGETVTLTCDIQGGGNIQWTYRWFKDGNTRYPYTKRAAAMFSFRADYVSDSGEYSCRGERSDSQRSDISAAVTLTVSDLKPKPELTSDPAGAALTGNTVTLTCRMDLSTGWDFYWYKHTLNSETKKTETNSYRVKIDSVSDGGQYWCRAGRGKPVYYTQYSDALWVNVTVSPKAVVTVRPDERVFRGETVTLRCDIKWGGDTEWTYRWETEGTNYQYKNSVSRISTQELNISSVDDFHRGKYTCTGQMGTQSSQRSDAVTLTVSAEAQAAVRVSPQPWLTEGDSVTLICEVTGSSTGWTFSWFRDDDHLSDSSRGAGGSYTLSPAALQHTGVYTCRAERGPPAYYTNYSNTQPLWITGVSSSVSLVVSPSRSQHFSSESLSLSCEDQSNSGWTVRRYTDRNTEDCSKQTGSTCRIVSLSTSDTGVYWCQSESGDKCHPLNITVHDGDVILVSSVDPVIEGDTLTLHCLHRSTNSSILRADFYKDGSLVQNQTTGEMSITAVSKSHEGFYYCKTERGQSLHSWISLIQPKPVVKVSPDQRVFRGETVTLTCDIQGGGNIQWTYSWFKDGSVIKHITWRVYSITSVSDSGQYNCRGERSDSQRSDISDAVTLTVSDLPTSTLTVTPDSPVFTGETVNLKCVIESDHRDWRYEWYKGSRYNSVMLQTSDRYTVNGDTVIIKRVITSDAGQYWCRGQRDKRPNSSQSSSVSFMVTERPKPVVKVNPDQRVFRGETVTLKCDIQGGGNIQWTYSWFKDGNTRYPYRTTTAEFSFRADYVSDSGEYRCRGERSDSQTSDISAAVTLTVSDLKPKPEFRSDLAGAALTGSTVTLTCRMDLSTGWDFYWYKHTLNSETKTETNSYRVKIDSVSDGGQYWCRAGRGKPVYYTQYSDALWVNVTVSPKAVVTVRPDERVFRGETVTLRCDIKWGEDTEWTYRWETEGTNYQYKNSVSRISTQELNISSVDHFHRGKYTCTGQMGRQSSQRSDAVTLTVSAEAQAAVRVSPQPWLTEGDSVTLICEVTGSSTGWTFSWFRDDDHLSDSSRGAGGSYTLSPAALQHTGVYTCRAERGPPAYYTKYSNTQPLWITGKLSQVPLVVSPNRSQHFSSESLSLSCEDQSNSGWTVRRYTDRNTEDCSKQTGSTCRIVSLSTSDTGVYWCQSESGDKRHPLNITVHDGDVILVSSVDPVIEGDTLTLHCLHRSTNSSILRADFYKDGSLVQNQTTGEMSITTVSKSHEGFYYCKTERGQSLHSWISVRVSCSGQISVFNILSFLLAACPYLLSTVVLLFKCYRVTSTEEQSHITEE
ncbi:basement membrane-specific heparan sulfate proteoglycan core protein-like [Garra rufa]|uniref:basement membrane-specific heparan sulfate proteoglycan core protein-like n=1 Tax=Garra rufa TaxID=137080 RepID=UPI003CCEAFC8